MKVHINDISTISHQLMADGIPCDRYVAFVKVSRLGPIGLGARVWYLRIYARSIPALERKLTQYKTDAPVDVPESELFDKTGARYGETRNTIS